MPDNKTAAISFAFAWIPYILVAWAYVAFTDGILKDFWIALGFLLAVRLFFVVIETFGSILAWRLYGRRIAVRKMLRFLSDNNFPKKLVQPHDDFFAYLVRIQEDASYPEKTRMLARESEREIARMEGVGPLWAMRIDYAVQAALDRYTRPGA